MVERISDRVELVTPSNYQRTPLPGLKKWTTALRSGQYQQGPDYLHNDGLMCCLGVLCEIQGRPSEKRVVPKGVNRVLYDDDSMVLARENPLYAFLGENGDFPPSCSATVWPTYDAPGDRRHRTYQSLTELNDESIPFTDIATVIERLWFDPEHQDG